ncbi:MAG: sugar-binding protein [Clostridiales Family XIII bacterium]|jgi:putative multiple sugar transport system substrate-binding protein|nr:sugar-binding protein [Clostridiales Family XIII bacterium]
MKKKLFSILLVIAMVFTLSACGGGGGNNEPASNEPSDQPAASGENLKVGVSMPTQSLQRWNQDGSNMKQQLEAQGYEVDLQYAGDNDIPTQVAQLENMISTGCQVLVIAAIDGTSLTNVVDSAKDAGIAVIAYDRLIMNTDGVAYYATFDNTLVGRMQGEYIRDTLDLDNTSGPYNLEMFTGSPDDNNIVFFFGGALEVLQPYIDSGKLVVPSGQTERDQCAIQSWSSEIAQSRMENLIAAQGYGPNGTKLDAVLCSNDSTAQGVTTALKNAGYTADNFPIITGQDCDKPSVINMKQGTQSMSVFKDTRTLAARVVLMVDSILKGTEPELNDTETYDNGTGVIPSFLCDPVVGTIDNYKELLIDSGYYTEADVTPEE